MLDIAIKFGKSLDNDNFERTKELLNEDCIYVIGEDRIVGPERICKSYEDNMIEGRKKLDLLEWGTSKVQKASDTEWIVHFTDHLTHKNLQYVHRCQQRLFIEHGKIYRIEHIDDSEEQSRLDEFYQKVGLI